MSQQPSTDKKDALLRGVENLLQRCLRHGLLRAEAEAMIAAINDALTTHCEKCAMKLPRACTHTFCPHKEASIPSSIAASPLAQALEKARSSETYRKESEELAKPVSARVFVPEGWRLVPERATDEWAQNYVTGVDNERPTHGRVEMAKIDINNVLDVAPRPACNDIEQSRG